jgi:SNF2 family DNA or RNA helicase
MSMILKVTKLRGTPVFTTFGQHPLLQKVYGATKFEGDPLWYFPAFYPVHQLVLKDFQALRLSAQLSPAAAKVVQQLDNFEERVQKRTLPKGFQFKTQPFEHQRDGLVHLTYFFRAALFYSCGLGKTKVVIDWQRAVKSWPLILCPRVVLHVWAYEAARHGIEQEFAIIDGKTPAKKKSQIADAKGYRGAVISYDSARRYYEQLIEDVPYDAIVADESHYIKAPTAARTKTSLELSKKAARRVIMSGTPSTGDPRDLYSQLEFLGPCFVPEAFWKFKQRFCITAPKNKYVVIGFKNLDVLQKRTSLVAIRRRKRECLDLPDRHIVDIPVLIRGQQLRVYNGLIASKEFAEIAEVMREEGILTEAGIVDIPNGAILVNKLIQVTGGFLMKKTEEPDPCDGCLFVRDCVENRIKPYTKKCKVIQKALEVPIERMKENAKMTLLFEKLENILADEENKVIIWGQFIEELDWISERLSAYWSNRGRIKEVPNDLDAYHVRVDGSSSGQVHELADKFNNDPLCKVYLGQVSTGVGVTLNAANYMIYYSLPWKMVDYEQSLDRNHRVGQQRSVTALRFIGEHTVDECIAKALTTKFNVAETITTEADCTTCDQAARCSVENIQPYKDGCKFSRSLARPITKVRTL